MIYGSFRELLSDNGSNFAGEVLQDYTKLLGTKHRFTTSYHSRTNEKVENFNRLLDSILTKLLVNKPIIL